jgi:hypothetical protein
VGATAGAREVEADAAVVATRAEAGSDPIPKRPRVGDWEAWGAVWDDGASSNPERRPPFLPGEEHPARVDGGEAVMGRRAQVEACPVASPGGSDA